MVTILEPGIYDGAGYTDLPPGLSYSGAKDILRSPARYKAKREQPRVPSEAMELGTIIHALVLDQPFCWREIEGGYGVTKRREAARAAGLVPITSEELAGAGLIALAVLEDEQAVALIERCAHERREVTAVAQDPETGVWVRGIFDGLDDGGRYGLDLKTGREDTLDDFARTAANLGYDIQAATYLSIMEWLGEPLEAFYFVVVETAPPYFVGVRELDAEFVGLGRRKLRRALDTYAECVASGVWPGPPSYQTVSAPMWALRQEGM